MNQGLIMDKGGALLLAKTASKTDDPQTLRMVAGALANLCGNGELMVILQHLVEKYSLIVIFLGLCIIKKK
jgi:kinesin family protein 5